MTTVPASVVLRAVVDLLAAQRQRLHRRVHRNPRAASDSKTAGRKQDIARLDRLERELQSLQVKGTIRADVAGLLLAWAAGHDCEPHSVQTLENLCRKSLLPIDSTVDRLYIMCVG